MARHRRLPTLEGQLWRALTRTLALTAGAAVLVVGGAGAAYVAERSDDVTASVDGMTKPADPPERRLMERFDCSTQGYGESAEPRSAIVRAPRGALRVVSFEEGWRLHTEGGATQLVAVCLRPVR